MSDLLAAPCALAPPRLGNDEVPDGEVLRVRDGGVTLVVGSDKDGLGIQRRFQQMEKCLLTVPLMPCGKVVVPIPAPACINGWSIMYTSPKKRICTSEPRLNAVEFHMMLTVSPAMCMVVFVVANVALRAGAW